jgi:hypothetical protein
MKATVFYGFIFACLSLVYLIEDNQLGFWACIAISQMHLAMHYVVHAIEEGSK